MKFDTKGQFKYLMIVPVDEHGTTRYNVKGVGTYERHSVLSGQDKIVFLESFNTLNEAQEEYPNAVLTHELLQPRNTYDHLPDEPDY